MKKLFLILVFSFLSCMLFSAPFGLKMGMTVEEIAAQCEDEPSYLRDDIYLIKPTKNHPLFKYYVAYVDEKTGLYQIRAISDSVTCNKYGTEIQNAFNTVKDRIAKTYGKPKIENKVDSTILSVWQRNEFWFQTLKDGSRVLSAVWGEKTMLADDLETVALDCVAEDGYLEGTAHLVLYYYFKNTSSVEDEQDSVF